MAFCRNCGSVLPEEAKFCPGCGRPAAEHTPSPVSAYSPSPPPPRRGRRLLRTLGRLLGGLLAAGVCLLLLLAGGGLLLSRGVRSIRTPAEDSRPTATARPTIRPAVTQQPTSRPAATPQPTSRPAATPQPTSRPAATPQPTSRPTAAPAGIRPEVKERLDAYESMADEYVAFLHRYSEADGDELFSMLGDYYRVLMAWSDMSEKLDALDETELSDAELIYYLEVTARVTQKLVAGLD